MQWGGWVVTGTGASSMMHESCRRTPSQREIEDASRNDRARGLLLLADGCGCARRRAVRLRLRRCEDKTAKNSAVSRFEAQLHGRNSPPSMGKCIFHLHRKASGMRSFRSPLTTEETNKQDSHCMRSHHKLKRRMEILTVHTVQDVEHGSTGT